MGNQAQPFKIQHLSPGEMANHERKGLCYKCDEKYVKGHRCREQKLFQKDVSLSIIIDTVSLEEPSEDKETE